MAALFAVDPARGQLAAERFARGADGDFNLLLIAPAQHRALLLNDALGRLPLYYRRDGASLAFAREIKFLRGWNAAGTPPDRLAIAQTLLFGWSLGGRTLESGVSRLPEATAVEIDWRAGVVGIRPYMVWNFDEYVSAGARYDNASDLAEVFVDRCSSLVRWAAQRHLLVALSGGLDSRTVAAGLSRAGAAFTGVTFSDAANANRTDVALAERVAAALGKPWRRYSLNEAGWEALESIVHLRDGQNYVGVAYILEFLSSLQEEFGDACYLTGDGGDKILRELTYPFTAKTLDAFVEGITSNAIWPLEATATMLGLARNDVVDSVREQFAAYPERSPQGRRDRFVYGERGWHWLFEGEDRNRAFLWSMTPFYAQSFYRRALAVPAAHKRAFRYYAEFMRALVPAVAAIPNADWDAPIGSPKAAFRTVLEAAALRVPRALRKGIRQRVRPFRVPAEDTRQLAGLLQRIESTGVFSTTAVAAALASDCSRFQYDMLVTQLLYQDYKATHESHPPENSGLKVGV
jgi:asparagine synthase (glutamine-hydrolysing)